MEIADKNVMMKVLDSCYEKALTGLPISESVYDLADEYCRKYSDPKVAAKKTLQCSGFKVWDIGVYNWTWGDYHYAGCYTGKYKQRDICSAQDGCGNSENWRI